MQLPHLWSHPALLQGVRRDTVTRNVDIVPTVADLLDIPLEDEVAGRSVAPLLRGDDALEPVVGFSETFFGKHNKVAAYGDGFYWVLDRKSDSSMLFRSDDYFAMNDLVATEPERVEAFAEHVAQWEARWPISKAVQEVEISTDLREQLEAIGYVE